MATGLGWGLLYYAKRNTPHRVSIQSFRCRDTEALMRDGTSRRFANIAAVALRKLDYLHAAGALNDLRVPPGNRLEALRGDRAGQHSIRVNDQWRICFVWTQAGPAQVEICDYH
jgi:proteic killer suppression protein